MALCTCPVLLRFLLQLSTLEVEHTRTHLAAYELALTVTLPAVVVVVVVLRLCGIVIFQFFL